MKSPSSALQGLEWVAANGKTSMGCQAMQTSVISSALL